MAHPQRFDDLLASLGSPRTSGARRLPPRGRDELPVIPDHELIRCIGQGAYGEVWLARSVLGTCRAVKIVFRDSFSSDQPYEREFRGIQHFEPISRTNDGLMDILQVGRNDVQGCFYYVMELADDARALVGVEVTETVTTSQSRDQSLVTSTSTENYVPHTLQFDLKQHRRLPGAECVQLGLALTSALGHLHRHGLIHRDIKPSNIIFVQGVPKLADIGLVVEVEEALSFVGTEGYIPPEGPTSAKADLYSLGKVLYEASNGKDRKEYPEPMSGLRDLPDRVEQDILLELNAVILKACTEEVRERDQSADEFHADLALIQSGKSVRRRRRLETQVAVLTRVAMGVGLAAALGLGAYAFQRGQTATARRLSQENRQLAEAETRQRERAEDALLQVQLQRAQELLGQQKNGAALAQLGHLLRQHPTNRFIAEQILATLSYRSFALPIARLSEGSGLMHARLSSDGLRIVTISTNGTAQVWNARTAEPDLTLLDATAAHAVEISPDGNSVAMVAEGEVRVASALTGKVEMSFAEKSHIDRLALNRDGSQLLIVNKNEAWVREIATGKTIAGPLKHKSKIDTAIFSLTGDRILTSSRDSTARLWEIQTGRMVREFEHKSSELSLRGPSLSPDGMRVATLLTTANPGGNAARIWNASTGEALSDVIDCKFPIRVPTFSPDGSRIIIGGNIRHAWICDGHSGRRLIGPLEYEEAIWTAAFSPDGQKAAIGSGNGFVRLWDTRTGAMLASSLQLGMDWGWSRVNFLEFNHDGARLLVSGSGGTWLWDVQDGAAKSRVLQHDAAVTFARFSSDAQRVVTAMDDQTISSSWWRPNEGRAAVVWDVKSGQQLTPPLLHERGVITAAFSADGKKVATGSWDRTARLWNAETGARLCDPLLHPAPVRSAFFNADGTQLWTGCWDHSSWLWNAAQGKLLKKLLASDGVDTNFSGFPIRTDDLSPDQAWLVTCGRTYGRTNGLGGVQVWNAHTGERRYVQPTFDGNIRTARFTSDGKRFVTSSYSTVHIWDAQTGRSLVGPIRHKGHAPIHSAEFSADGTKVVTGGSDGTACVWNSETGKLMGQPMRHKGEVVHAAFGPDSKRVVTASWWDHAAFIWDAETGLQIGPPLQHDDWVTFAEFSPDGKWIITTSSDKTARIWQVATAVLPVPEWLADLAEAIAGQQIDAAGIAKPVPLEQLLELRVRLTASTEPDFYTRFGKWFFADRSTRPISAR